MSYLITASHLELNATSGKLRDGPPTPKPQAIRRRALPFKNAKASGTGKRPGRLVWARVPKPPFVDLEITLDEIWSIQDFNHLPLY